MKFNRFDRFDNTTKQHKKQLYINETPLLSISSYQKNSLSSTVKSQSKHGEDFKQNKIAPEPSCVSPNLPQFSPQKRKGHNSNSASFDKFLVSISKSKILKILLSKKPKKKPIDYRNHIIINSNGKSKDDSKDDSKDKDNIDHYQINSISNIVSCTNSSNKKNQVNPYLYLDYTLIDHNSLKSSEAKHIASIKAPLLSQTKSAFVLKKVSLQPNPIKQNTRNKKDLCFPHILNSYAQMTKMNSLVLRHKESHPSLRNDSSKQENSDSNSINNHSRQCQRSKPSQMTSKHSESNFDTREVDGRVNDVYKSISVKKSKKSLPNQPMSSESNDYHDIIWNNINGVNEDIAKLHLQKQKERDQNDDDQCNETKNNEASSFKPDRHSSKESTVKMQINCHDILHKANKTLSDLLIDTIIYNEDNYVGSQNENERQQHTQSLSESSTSNEVEEDDSEEEVIENDDSVNEHASNEENVSHKLKTFKSLKCFHIKSSYFAQLASSLPFVIHYLNLKSISSLIQVNSYLSKNLSQILYNDIGNIILKGANRQFLSMIKPSIFRFSPIVNSPDVSAQYRDYLHQRCIYSTAIAKDLKRTIIEDASFTSGSTNSSKLRNILNAYANYNKRIGYAQGMNFLVANAIYLFSKEEEAFLFIDGLVNRFHLENLYGVDNSLNHLMEQLGDLIRKHAPMVVSYLNSNGLCHEFFTTNWVLTLFANSMKTRYLFMLWDFVLVFGWRFFLFFCIEVIKWNEEEILLTEVKYLSMTMKGLMKREEFERNFAEVIEGTFTLMRRR